MKILKAPFLGEYLRILPLHKLIRVKRKRYLYKKINIKNDKLKEFHNRVYSNLNWCCPQNFFVNCIIFGRSLASPIWGLSGDLSVFSSSLSDFSFSLFKALMPLMSRSNFSFSTSRSKFSFSAESYSNSDSVSILSS